MTNPTCSHRYAYQFHPLLQLFFLFVPPYDILEMHFIVLFPKYKQIMNLNHSDAANQDNAVT